MAFRLGKTETVGLRKVSLFCQLSHIENVNDSHERVGSRSDSSPVVRSCRRCIRIPRGHHVTGAKSHAVSQYITDISSSIAFICECTYGLFKQANGSMD